MMIPHKQFLYFPRLPDVSSARPIAGPILQPSLPAPFSSVSHSSREIIKQTEPGVKYKHWSRIIGQASGGGGARGPLEVLKQTPCVTRHHSEVSTED